VRACRSCSDAYGISADLKRLGASVEYMGKPMSKYLRDDNCRVITV